MPLIETEYDRMPAIKLGGNISSSGYYESFFDGALPFANEALMTFSDHQAVNVQFSYPVREEKGMPCGNQKCRGGYLDRERTKICDTCKGTGMTLSRSPWGVYITKEQTILEGEKQQVIPAVQFHSPDSAILDDSRQRLLSSCTRGWFRYRRTPPPMRPAPAPPVASCLFVSRLLHLPLLQPFLPALH